MAVYKRGRVYWYDFVFHGRRYQGSCNTRTKRIAEQIQTKKKNDLALGLAGLMPIEAAPTLNEFKERFLAFIDNRHRERPRTAAYYRERYARLLEFEDLAGSTLDTIDQTLMERYIQQRRRKVSATSVNRELGALRRALRIAYEWRLLPRVPKVTLLPQSEEHRREFVLSYEQEKAYLASCGDPLGHVAVLILDTGLRPGEAVSLEWKPRREAAGWVVTGPDDEVRRIHIERGKTRNARRDLPLTPRAREMLASRLEFFGEERWVFPGRNPARPFRVASLDHQHRRVRDGLIEDGDTKNLGFEDSDFVPHSLRHTFGTRLGESGADAFTIMKVMGHTSITVSQRYVHPTAGRVESAFTGLEAMNRILRGDAEAEEAMLGVPTESPTDREP